MSVASPPNPFEASCDPRTYVPRPVCEGALLALTECIDRSYPATLLVGPAGIGKTMLLSVLRDRLAEEHRVVYVSVGAPLEAELSHRVVGLLGESRDKSPHDALIAAAERYAKEGTSLVVLVDNASDAPLASSLELVRTASEVSPALSVVFAVSDEGDAAEFENELASAGQIAAVTFDELMTAEESVNYIWTRLAHAGTSNEVLEELDDGAIRWILYGTDGLPEAINERASRLLQALEDGDEWPEDEDYEDEHEHEDEGVAGEAPEYSSHPFIGPSSSESPTKGPSPSPENGTTPRGSLGGGLIGTGHHFDSDYERSLASRFGPGFLNEGGKPVHPIERVEEKAEAAEPASDESSAEESVSIPSVTSLPAYVEATSLASLTDREVAPAVDRESALARIRLPTAPEERAEAEEAETEEESTAWPFAFGGRQYRIPPTLGALIISGLVLGFAAGRFDPFDEEVAGPDPGSIAAKESPVVESGLADAPEAVPAGIASSEAMAPKAERAAPPTVPAKLAKTTPAAKPDRSVEVAKTTTPEPTKAAGATAPAPTQRAKSDGGTKTAVAAAPAKSKPATSTSTVANEPKPAKSTTTVAKKSTAAPATPTLVAASVAPVAASSAKPQQVASAKPRATKSVSSPPARKPASRPAARRPAPEPTPMVMGPATAIMVGSQGFGAGPESRPGSYVRVRVDLEPGSILSIDGQIVGEAPLADLMVLPGSYTFVAQAPDGLAIEQLVNVSPSTRIVEF